MSNRDVAQFGSALDWGSRGRRFKSCRPDQKSKTNPFEGSFFYWEGTTACAAGMDFVCVPTRNLNGRAIALPFFYEGRQPAQQAWTLSIGFEPKGSPKCYQALLARGSRLKSEACLDASELLRPDQLNTKERANALSLFVQETTACAAGMDFVTF